MKVLGADLEQGHFLSQPFYLTKEKRDRADCILIESCQAGFSLILASTKRL
jgi:hypothetical protein